MAATSNYVPPPPLSFNDSPASMSKRVLATKKRPLPRKVGFAESRTYAINNRVEQFSEGERSSLWYNSRDYAIFGKDAKKTVKHIRKGRSFSGLTGRGLEKYFSSQYHEEKKRRELGHTRAILVEQQRQRLEGIFNPKILKMMSTVNSKWALQNALELAQHDHSEVTDKIPAASQPPPAQPSGNDFDSDTSSIDLSL
jgi:hypothetical protein